MIYQSIDGMKRAILQSQNPAHPAKIADFDTVSCFDGCCVTGDTIRRSSSRGWRWRDESGRGGGGGSVKGIATVNRSVSAVLLWLSVAIGVSRRISMFQTGMPCSVWKPPMEALRCQWVGTIAATRDRKRLAIHVVKKEKPEPTKTGMRQLLLGVEKGTKQPRDMFVDAQIVKKKTSIDVEVIKVRTLPAGAEVLWRKCLEVIEPIQLGSDA